MHNVCTVYVVLMALKLQAVNSWLISQHINVDRDDVFLLKISIDNNYQNFVLLVQ